MEARTGQVTSTLAAALDMLDALLATVSSPTASPISSDPAVWRPSHDHQQGHRSCCYPVAKIGGTDAVRLRTDLALT